MLKQKRRYDRVSSCSQLSVNQSDMTLRSRNTSGESAFMSSDDKTSCTYTNQRQSVLNKDKLPVENGSKGGKNLRKIGKKKQYMRKKRQRVFKDTIVLAPFHALKQCFQTKLKDLYKKGLLESNAKRVKIPNNSLFQYEVMEMRANQSEAEGQEAKKVDSSSKKRKSEQSDQSEYCHCFRKRTGEEQKKSGVNSDLPSTSSAAVTADKVTQPQAKKLRTQTPAEQIRKDEGRKSVRQSRGHTSKNRQSKGGDVQRGKTQPRKIPDNKAQKGNNIKYNTRSVTRKETVQDDEHSEDGKDAKQAESQNNKAQTEQKDRKKTDETVHEDTSRQDRAATLLSMRSNSSVIFLEEITSPKAEIETKPERAAEENVTAISAVTQMFDTLLKSSGDDVMRKFRSGSGGKKLSRRSPSCSSDRRPDGDIEYYNQRPIEANVVVQEPNQDSSSSERISEDSRTVDTVLTPTSSSKQFPHRPDKPAAYIFGPKCPYQEIRESCEFGFGMSRTFSDDEVDDCPPNGNVDFKKHR